MFIYAFTFRSFTAAQSGRNVLQQLQIDAQLQRAPKRLTEQGCGYVLRVAAPAGASAAEALRAYGAPVVQIYRCFPNGLCQEAEL